MGTKLQTVSRSFRHSVVGLVLVIGTAGSQVSANTQSSNAKYVDTVFRDLLLRPANDAEINRFATQLSRGTPRVRVISEIERLPGHRIQQTRRSYTVFLGREPTPSELKAGALSLSNGGRVDALEARIIGTNEYFTKKGKGTNTGFLTRLYSDAFGGSIRPAELSSGLDALARGKSRTVLAREMLNMRNSYALRVNDLFRRYLRRSASQAELSTFVEVLRGGDREETVISLIMAIDEYYFSRHS